MGTKSAPVTLDTHALIWWSVQPDLLSSRARNVINSATELRVPTIVYWETSLLLRKRRLELDMTVAEWTEQLKKIRRITNVPLSTEIALMADALQMHADPADRFIVASALVGKTKLVTKDKRIRRLKVATVW